MIALVDRYLGSDPGGERLRSSVNLVAAWLAALGAAAILESLTHAFEVSAAHPGAAATNHIARLVVVMIGSTVALTAGFVVADTAVRARFVTALIAALGLWAGVALAVAVHPSRAVALIMLVIVPSAGAWFRRYGGRGFAPSFTVHVGYLIGFLVAPQITGHLQWVGAVIGVSALATYAVGLISLPGHARATSRMERSYRARARRVLALTASLMDASPHSRATRRLARRLRMQVVRLNETAVVLDTQLSSPAPDANEVETNELRRLALFEHERAVATLARLARVGAHHGIGPETRSYARAVLAAARDLDSAALAHLAASPAGPAVTDEIAHRYGEAARALASAVNLDIPPYDSDHEHGASAGAEGGRQVNLVAGWLPGAVIVNAAASSQPGASWMDRIPMTVSTRVTIQLAVALALAVTFGDLISPAHVLWAVVAVYVTFLGGTSDREQLRKAAFRIAGTLLGVIAGDGLAHLTALHAAPTLVVIGLAVFFMSYFAKVNYALVVFAVTLGVTQFYAQVGELSNAILVARVEVTAAGAACAIVVGLTVFPLRTANAAKLALISYLRALADVLDGAITSDAVRTPGPRTSTRLLDADFHAATAALRPLTMTLFATANDRCSRVLRLVDLSHEFGRSVVHDSGAGARTGNERKQLAELAQQTADLARALADDLQHSSVNPVPGSGAVIEAPGDDASPAITIKLHAELEAIAAALGELARIRGVAVPVLTPN